MSQLAPDAATSNVVRAFRMATFPVWCCAILVVLAPWRPIVRRIVPWGLSFLERRRQTTDRLQEAASAAVVLALLSLVLILSIVSIELWSAFREEIPDLRRVRSTLPSSRLCRHTSRPDDQLSVGFFIESPRTVVSIGGLAVLRGLILLAHSVFDTSASASKAGRAVSAVWALLLWETVQRSMGHSLVVALVDALDLLVCYANALACRALCLHWVERAPYAVAALARIPPALWVLREFVLRPSALALQLICANVAFGSACADEDVGGAAFSILVALSTLAVHLSALGVRVGVAVLRGVIALHINVATKGWETGSRNLTMRRVKED